MNDRLRVAAFAASLAVGTIALPTASSAQSMMPSGRTAVPVVLWAAAGAVVGAVAWPMLFPTTVVAAGGVPIVEASVWSWGSFATTRAAVGAVVGGVLGYSLAP